MFYTTGRGKIFNLDHVVEIRITQVDESHHRREFILSNGDVVSEGAGVNYGHDPLIGLPPPMFAALPGYFVLLAVGEEDDTYSVEREPVIGWASRGYGCAVYPVCLDDEDGGPDSAVLSPDGRVSDNRGRWDSEAAWREARGYRKI